MPRLARELPHLLSQLTAVRLLRGRWDVVELREQSLRVDDQLLALLRQLRSTGCYELVRGLPRVLKRLDVVFDGGAERLDLGYLLRLARLAHRLVFWLVWGVLAAE